MTVARPRKSPGLLPCAQSVPLEMLRVVVSLTTHTVDAELVKILLYISILINSDDDAIKA